MNSRKILIADDDGVCREMLKATIATWGYRIIEAEDGQTALRLLRKDSSLRLAVIDWMMPKLDGPEVCRHLRADRKSHYVYVILLTSKAQKDSLIEGLNAGADDYLVKPFHPAELQQRIRAGQRVLDMQENLFAIQEALRYKATHDPLTGILNRGALFGSLEREMDRASQSGSTLGLIIGDLDEFKNINDTYGHAVGDGILQAVSKRICSQLRARDVVGRYGGEEFMIITPNATSAQSVRVAERIRTTISARPIDLQGIKVRATMSLGVANIDEFPCATANDLLTRADHALYCAKSKGRNCVHLSRKPWQESGPDVHSALGCAPLDARHADGDTVGT